jgi:hypothetical protein
MMMPHCQMEYNVFICNCKNHHATEPVFVFLRFEVGVKIPQDGNRTNRYGHVAVVREHVWRTVCSVCATGARVAQPVPCNS